MHTAKLRRHFETHPDFTNKTADYFKRKSDELHVKPLFRDMQLQKPNIDHVWMQKTMCVFN